MHLHGHASGRNGELTQHIAGAETLCSVAIAIHVHITVAIGEHDFASAVSMVAHNTDGGVAIWPSGSPLPIVCCALFPISQDEVRVAGPNLLQGMDALRGKGRLNDLVK